MKKVLLMLLAIIVLFLAACSKDEKKADKNVTIDDTAEEPKEIVEPENTYPFTGIQTDHTTDDRLVGVMVNNHPKARPQSGLSQADIVFEILSEGNITRLLALFQSEKPEVVGPVRSAREYYFELADAYGALYIYHGAAGFIDEMIDQRGIEHLNGAIYDNDGNLFKRESFRKAPHNSYLLFPAVESVANSKEYEMKRTYEELTFLEEGTEIEGDTAAQATITYSNSAYSNVQYEYNPANETYTRYNGEEKTIELHTEEPIELDNVFIVEAYHEVIDSAGRRAIDMESGGDAYLLQQGKAQRLKWENQDGRIVPVKEGHVVGFVPGKTWINVVPSNPGIDESVSILSE
ncbi:DUF3048 domain-containing protein [Virgibacillus sp. W0430]|uniref:DUF3048 domain-containing protein n=1 Tax=Virgibacillus sp. W0430 TaxID=3391580 RepID=UPI003F47D375